MVRLGPWPPVARRSGLRRGLSLIADSCRRIDWPQVGLGFHVTPFAWAWGVTDEADLKVLHLGPFHLILILPERWV